MKQNKKTTRRGQEKTIQNNIDNNRMGREEERRGRGRGTERKKKKTTENKRGKYKKQTKKIK